MTPAAAIIIGATWYLGVWLGHDQTRTEIGEWQSPPVWLRKIVRLRAGPLYPAALAMQAWAVAMVMLGLATMFGWVPRTISADVLVAALYMIGPIGVFWFGLVVVDFVRRRR